MANFDQAFTILIEQREGVDLFVDRQTGEYSKFGITLKTASALGYCKEGDRKWIENLTLAQAKDFYFREFWTPLLMEAVRDQAVANKIFDMAVNEGHEQATVLAQRALNGLGATLTPDGRMGPFTLAAINRADPHQLLLELRAECCAFYDRLIRQHSEKYAKYRDNWRKRAES